MDIDANFQVSVGENEGFEAARRVTELYRDASFSHAAKVLKSGNDWEQAQAVIDDFDRKIDTAEQKFHDEYDARVETVRKRRIDEAGSKSFDQPTPVSRDRFDGDAINRQSHREVKFDHEREIDQLLDDRQAKLDGLMEKACRRDELRGHAKEQFRDATDRRSGPDRRQRER